MASDESAQDLNLLYSELLVLLKQEEELREETQRKLEKAKAVVDPRKEFNRWLQSKAGKSWKTKQFEFQKGKCAACDEPLRFTDVVFCFGRRYPKTASS